MEKDFKAIDHGEGQIDLSHHPHAAMMFPAELHHKSDGALGDKPSFCIAMTHPMAKSVAIGEISLETLTHALDELGYKLTKK